MTARFIAALSAIYRSFDEKDRTNTYTWRLVYPRILIEAQRGETYLLIKGKIELPAIVKALERVGYTVTVDEIARTTLIDWSDPQ